MTRTTTRATPVAVSFAGFAALGTVLFFGMLSLARGTWDGARPATCLVDGGAGCFCERLRTDSLVRQPSNTLSNVAFTAAGVYVLVAVPPRAAASPQFKAFAAIYAFTLFATGLASGAYHASFTFVGQVADIASMFFVTSASALHTLAARAKWSTATVFAAFAGSNALITFVQVAAPEWRRYLFAATVAAGVVLEVVAPPQRANRALLGYAVLCLAIAFVVFWLPDQQHMAWMCDEDAVFQGHAVWHALCAVGTVFLYHYHASSVSGGAGDSRRADSSSRRRAKAR